MGCVCAFEAANVITYKQKKWHFSFVVVAVAWNRAHHYLDILTKLVYSQTLYKIELKLPEFKDNVYKEVEKKINDM